MTNNLSQHDCKEELNQAELRATPARIAVMQFLETTNQPVDAGMVLDYLKTQNIDTDPATVFRMMNDFLSKGLTKQIQFQEGKTRYELSNKEDHHHLICENCGKIESVSDNVIPHMEKEIQEKQKFLVKRHSLEFFGLCKDCQK